MRSLPTFSRIAVTFAFLSIVSCTAPSRVAAIDRIASVAANQPDDLSPTLGLYFDSDGIVAFQPSRSARGAGVRRGDRLIEICGVGHGSANFRQLALDEIALLSPGESAACVVYRSGQQVQLSLPVREAHSVGIANDVKRKVAQGRFSQALAAIDAHQRGTESAATPLFLKQLRVAVIFAKTAQSAYDGAAEVARAKMGVIREFLRACELSAEVLDTEMDYLLETADWFRAGRQPSFSAEITGRLEAARLAHGQVPGQMQERTPEPAPSVQVAIGTGFSVTADGLILTAFHVVENAKEIIVTLQDGRTSRASVRLSSAANDLALLETNLTRTTPIPLVDSSEAELGERVFTLGFPAIGVLFPATGVLGQEPKFSDGSISAFSGIEGEAALLQMTVPIQPGNSGGPVVLETGQVIGVVTSSAAVSTFFRRTGTLPQNVNWAIKSDYALLLCREFELAADDDLDRTAAIERTRRAICFVEARH